MQKGLNKVKHFHRGSVTAGGYCSGEQFTSSGVSYPDYVVTQYFSITLEEFRVKTVDGVSLLPFDKSSTYQCAWDSDIGAYFTYDTIVSLL